MDGKLLKVSEVDLTFVSTVTDVQKEKKFAYRPERALVRYQFMEILVRLAQYKYMRNGLCESYAEAFRRLLEDGLQLQLEGAEDFQHWRNTRFWTMDVDLVVKEHLDFLRQLYGVWAGSRQQTQIGPKMSALEFKAMWSYYACFNEFYPERDCLLVFSQSIQSQVDELNENRHVFMDFVEFLEGLGRSAEKLSLPPPDARALWSAKQRVTQPLDAKLLHLIQLFRSHNRRLHSGREPAQSPSLSPSKLQSANASTQLLTPAHLTPVLSRNTSLEHESLADQLSGSTVLRRNVKGGVGRKQAARILDDFFGRREKSINVRQFLQQNPQFNETQDLESGARKLLAKKSVNAREFRREAVNRGLHQLVEGMVQVASHRTNPNESTGLDESARKDHSLLWAKSSQIVYVDEEESEGSSGHDAQ